MKLRPLLALALLFALTACGVTDWTNDHLPVIGQRCENWQCFTSSGQQQSEINHEQRLIRKPANVPDPSDPNMPTAVSPAAPAPMPVATPTAPVPPPADAPPAEPLAPPVGAEGAYVYVPRAKSDPGTTPFDGQMPAPIPAQ